jgi:acetate kinase
MKRQILCINSGSSSIKFALYAMGEGEESALGSGAVERIGQSAGRIWLQREGQARVDRTDRFPDQRSALQAILGALQETGCVVPDGVGHRVVSGGPRYLEHCRIDADFLQHIREYLRFAPLHLPAEIAAVEALQTAWPDIPQVACFDTAFHRTIPEVASRLPLPRNLWHEGVRKYGFHGLSYEYIVSRLGVAAQGRTIIAHLGNGASLAAVRDGRCMDTSMGLTPTGGLVMGTRCGDLDPGVLLYLIEEKGYDGPQLERLLNHLSGLLGISAISGDMQTLLSLRANEPHAQQALDIFAYSARKQIGALVAALGGIDRMVFTGGIGEHAAPMRWAICRGLEHLGLQLDPQRNDAQSAVISTAASAVQVQVIPTNEDLIIARHTQRLLFPPSGDQ